MWSGGVLSEYICSTNMLLLIFKSLFDYILITEDMPEKWIICNVMPVYKNKGDRSLSEKYRAICLLGCFGFFLPAYLMPVWLTV